MAIQQKILPLVPVVASRTPFGEFLRAGVCALALVAGSGPAAADLAPDEVQFKAPVYEIPGDIETLGERWRYKFYWNGLPVAHATIEGRERDVGPDRVLFVDMSAGTNSVISLLWRYRLDAEGTIYVEPFRPGTFVAAEIEKGDEMATRIQFDENGRVVAYRKKSDKEKEYDFTAPTTYEFMSTVYLLLNMDYEVGRSYLIDTLTGVSRFLLNAEVRAIEPYAVDGDTLEAYRIFVTTKELTDPDGTRKHFGTDFWVTTAHPRRFLGSRTETKWGAVTLRLVAIEPLGGPAPEPDSGEATADQQEEADSSPRHASDESGSGAFRAMRPR